MRKIAREWSESTQAIDEEGQARQGQGARLPQESIASMGLRKRSTSQQLMVRSQSGGKGGRIETRARAGEVPRLFHRLGQRAMAFKQMEQSWRRSTLLHPSQVDFCTATMSCPLVMSTLLPSLL